MTIAGRIIVASLVLASAVTVGAQPKTVDVGITNYVIPDGSPVQNPRLLYKDEEHSPAIFIGQFRITGTYHFSTWKDKEYRTDTNKSGRVLELFFKPDEDSSANLPTWTVRKDDGVRELFFWNDKEFLAKVVGTKHTLAVQAGKVKSISGRATIWVGDYTVASGCDHPQFYVTFLRMDEADLPKLASFDVSSSCG